MYSNFKIRPNYWHLVRWTTDIDYTERDTGSDLFLL